MTSPITGTGISVVTDRKWSLGVFYQSLDGHLGVVRHLDGVWEAGEQLKPKPVPGSPIATITWNNGKEIRVYYFDANYIVQEWCYTLGKNWYDGEIGKMKAKATPGSGLAAIVFGKEIDGGEDGIHIRVYYQESGTNTVKELGNDGSWYNGALSISGAMGCTNLAAVAYFFQNETQIRVYYQSEDLSLKEYGYNKTSKWFQGAFNPGKASYKTPMGVLAFGSVQLQVYWRDLHGHVVFARNTGSWSDPAIIGPVEPCLAFVVIQWDNGKYLRLFCQLYDGKVVEYYSDDGGVTWSRGKFQLQ